MVSIRRIPSVAAAGLIGGRRRDETCKGERPEDALEFLADCSLPHPWQLVAGSAVLRFAGVAAPLRWSRHRHPERTASAG